MAQGFHSFTCTPTRPSAIATLAYIRNRNPVFAFPAAAGTHLPTPKGWKAEWCEVAAAEIRTRDLPIANLALYHTATIAH